MALSKKTLTDMYWYMLLARRLDEQAWRLHRQGKITFHFSGIGHEAIDVGAAFAIQPGYDWVAPYYRDLALMLVLGLTPQEYLLGLMGKKGDPASAGRQMPNHWSLKRANVISHSSLAAGQTAQAVGIGLGIRLRGEDKLVLNCVGEGATSQGEWYEAVNWAAVHNLPVIFLVENNRYAISTRQDRQMAVEKVADKAAGLGLPGFVANGQDFREVHAIMQEAVNIARGGGGPALVEATTYRLTPHSSDDDDRAYRPREEVDTFRRRDPLLVAQKTLQAENLLAEESIAQMEARARDLIEEGLRLAERAPFPEPRAEEELVYARGDDPCLPSA